MTEQIKRVVAKGKPLSVIKGLITKELLRLDRAKFDEAIKVEYDELFPMYHSLGATETFEDLGELEDRVDELKKIGSKVTINYEENSLFSVSKIDYSQDENYKTFEEYKNETRVVQEAVYEDVVKTVTIDSVEVEAPDLVLITPEVTELVRPYTPIEVTDEMIQAELDKLGYIPKEKREAQKYLNDTDWYVVRYAEQGVEIPQEVLDKRQECREVL
jgi:hypothetical protein